MSETVLIVDDSLTVRMDLSQAFEAAGFRVKPCATLAEAHAALATGETHAIVLDVQLPDGDGVDFLAELRADPAHVAIPVLMLSTAAEVRDRVRGLRGGASEYVGKPYDANYMIAKTRELLRARHAGEASARPEVLVIDDSMTYREALRRALEDAGYAVTTAETGEDGLRIAAGRRPSAIIVDGVLPGIDGGTVIRKVRIDAALRGVPCLLLTGSGDRVTELNALDAGADAFVRKDDDMEVVLARLAATIRSAAAPASAESTVSLLGPRKILAVDDSPTYLNQISDILRDEGYDMVLAHSGEEALELLGVQPVDCILLDLLMPGMGGQETCRRIKSSGPLRDIPLIMLTALEDRAAMLDGLSAGADDYISKSSEFDVLKARVRAQIRRKQFEDENRGIREQLLQRELEAAEARAARELAETRASLYEELERKNRELEAFSYSVSHDLRAPLRGIHGFSRAVLEDCGALLPPKSQDYLRRVCAGAERMGELIDDLLQLSRVGRAELYLVETDLSAMARQVEADLRRREPERHASIGVQEGLTGVADARLIRIVFENLMGNAWKFTSKTADAKIEFGAQGSPGGLVYFVRDNGAGFDMEYADKLFRPFQRLHGEEEFPGTGIGLATIQRVIDRHGGRVWAEGTVGKGAAFFFTLGNRSGSTP